MKSYSFKTNKLSIYFYVNSWSSCMQRWLFKYEKNINIKYFIIIIRAEKIGLEAFLLRHDKKLVPFRFFYRHISYFACFERFLARLNMRRNLMEICRSRRPRSKRWPDLEFIDDKVIGGLVYRHANAVPCELKLTPADCLAQRRSVWW